MNTIYTIKFTPKRSNETYNVILSQTVLLAIGAIATTGRTTMSAQDVTYVINNNVNSRQQVEEAKVAKIMKNVAKDYANGIRYNALRGKLTSIDGYFYEYK